MDQQDEYVFEADDQPEEVKEEAVPSPAKNRHTTDSAVMTSEGMEFVQPVAATNDSLIKGGLAEAEIKGGASSFKGNQSMEIPSLNEQKEESDLSDGIHSDGRASLSAQSHEQINEIMKEEQNDFAYENMDNGSNKSFNAE